MLRTKILQEREKAPFRSLVVTSASPQEGKTVTVVNLALSFATLPSFKVLMVDGDMRRGTLGSWLGIDDNRSGLSNLIDGSAQLEDVILKSEELPMDFIVRGNSQAHDLSSSRYAVHFRKMMEKYDLVLVDSPPVNLITDVQLLAASCDAVLLIARAFSTNRKALEEAVRNLQPFRVIGTVLNAGEAQPSYRYNGYYY
jgi:capsular exopolysaccharide synthesis family protein